MARNPLTPPAVSTAARQRVNVGNFVTTHMNVSETENELQIEAELPGVSEKDVDVN